jgi:hypothetical protein
MTPSPRDSCWGLAEPHLITIIGKNGSEKHMTLMLTNKEKLEFFADLGRVKLTPKTANFTKPVSSTAPAGNGADLEKSFEGNFLAQGHPPAQAARLAKIAKAGPDYERRF